MRKPCNFGWFVGPRCTLQYFVGPLALENGPFMDDLAIDLPIKNMADLNYSDVKQANQLGY